MEPPPPPQNPNADIPPLQPPPPNADNLHPDRIVLADFDGLEDFTLPSGNPSNHPSLHPFQNVVAGWKDIGDFNYEDHDLNYYLEREYYIVGNEGGGKLRFPDEGEKGFSKKNTATWRFFSKKNTAGGILMLGILRIVLMTKNTATWRWRFFSMKNTARGDLGNQAEFDLDDADVGNLANQHDDMEVEVEPVRHEHQEVDQDLTNQGNQHDDMEVEQPPASGRRASKPVWTGPQEQELIRAYDSSLVDAHFKSKDVNWGAVLNQVNIAHPADLEKTTKQGQRKLRSLTGKAAHVYATHKRYILERKGDP